MRFSKRTPGYKGIDISYDIANEKFSLEGNVEIDELVDMINQNLNDGFDKEPLDYDKGCRKQRFYHISIRDYKDKKTMVSDTGNRELTDDILLDLLGELQDTSFFSNNIRFS